MTIEEAALYEAPLSIYVKTYYRLGLMFVVIGIENTGGYLAILVQV